MATSADSMGVPRLKLTEPHLLTGVVNIGVDGNDSESLAIVIACSSLLGSWTTGDEVSPSLAIVANEFSSMS